MDHVTRILEQWHRERPDLDVEPMGLLGRFARLHTRLSREIEAVLVRHGLNRASFDVLATLRRAGAPFHLSPGDLLAATMVTSGTMTNRIDQLEKQKLVARLPNPEDGRSVLIGLTDAGLALIDQAVTDHVANQHRLTAMLEREEFEQLDALLAAYLERIDR
ncbi:MarR family winged helix-turn-helix transcriptional regulator [Rhizobium sp. SSA_523]|uniref:MarR family winged helix-turn-helix transcriptional regulator n=1 Tax=Rhizobium sp. SSA_523 TaxID=2952477 RepID=UPI0020900BC9|nr:MarR family transcriptional regulator [Rhizobium sp. SSA_523]MCO5732745.1 MarR family transcriptional regulator [Rhizobium sp. SSA_523]WKC23635.1 MarR family transcriptional regulator [Rhizobium sp. SSA_523]